MTHPNEKTRHAFVDHTLAPNERAEVERHLETCPRCRQEIDELTLLCRDLAQLPKAAPSEGLLKKTLAAQQEIRWGNVVSLDLFSLLFGRTGLIAVSAGLMVGLLLGLSIAFMQPSNSSFDGVSLTLEEETLINATLMADAGDFL